MVRPTAITGQSLMLKSEYCNGRHTTPPVASLGQLHWLSRFFPGWEGIICLAIFMCGLETGQWQFSLASHECVLNSVVCFENAPSRTS